MNLLDYSRDLYENWMKIGKVFSFSLIFFWILIYNHENCIEIDAKYLLTLTYFILFFFNTYEILLKFLVFKKLLTLSKAKRADETSQYNYAYSDFEFYTDAFIKKK